MANPMTEVLAGVVLVPLSSLVAMAGTLLLVTAWNLVRLLNDPILSWQPKLGLLALATLVAWTGVGAWVASAFAARAAIRMILSGF